MMRIWGSKVEVGSVSKNMGELNAMARALTCAKVQIFTLVDNCEIFSPIL